MKTPTLKSEISNLKSSPEAPYQGKCAYCRKPVYHHYPSWTKNPEKYNDAEPLHEECELPYLNPLRPPAKPISDHPKRGRISRIRERIIVLFRPRTRTATIDLIEMEHRIMSAISDYAAKQAAFNQRQATAIDALVDGVNGLTGDVQTLNEKITELQNSAGQVTPEDQALIDAMEAQGEALATRLEGVSAALAALDAQTPPKPPVEPPSA